MSSIPMPNNNNGNMYNLSMPESNITCNIQKELIYIRDNIDFIIKNFTQNNTPKLLFRDIAISIGKHESYISRINNHTSIEVVEKIFIVLQEKMPLFYTLSQEHNWHYSNLLQKDFFIDYLNNAK